MNSFRRLGATGGVAVLIALVVAAVSVGDRSEDSGAAAQVIAHGALVPESPERDHPIVIGTSNDQQVLAAEQVGRAIVVGGSFTQVETIDGVTLAQPFFAAWSIDTGEMICPGLLQFDDEVLAIEPGPSETQLWVGGRFDKATGADGKIRPRNKLALVDLSDCSVDRIFAATGANAKVADIVYVNGRLFVGGDFTSIGGVARSVLAELDPVTAAVNTSFSLQFSGGMASSKVRGMGANPEGTRLVLGGRFGTVSDGVTTVANSATTVIDITSASPRLTAHSWTQPHAEWGNRPLGQSLQDVSVSSDGSLIALAFGTATVSDYVYLVPAVEAPTSHRWQHYMRDSSFSVAVSDAAVYVQGHFCKIDDGPGITEVMEKRLDFRCTGDGFAGGAYRTQIAALSLTDGTPLAWNPGVDAFNGGRVLTVTERGLLAGFDGNRANGIRTGSLAFFDFGIGVEDTEAPSQVAVDSIETSEVDGGPVVVRGSATDDLGVEQFDLAYRSDGNWLQLDGSLGPDYVEFVVSANDGQFEHNTALPAGDWKLQVRAVDLAGRTSPEWTESAFATGIAAPQPECSHVRVGTTRVVTWTPVEGEDDFHQVRVDGSWVADVPVGTNTWTHDAPGEDSQYIIRSREAGVTTDVPCEDLGGDPPPAPAGCRVDVAADGSTNLMWDAVPGEDDSYLIRVDGVYRESVGVDAERTWSADPGDGATFLVRSREGGVNTDLLCE